VKKDLPNIVSTIGSGAFAHSWENRRCRLIVHTADLPALVIIHAFPECTS